MFDKTMNHHLFQALSDESKVKLRRNIKEIAYKPNAYLIRENVPNEYLFLLLSGSVKVESNTGDLIAVLREGSVIGEISSTGISQPIANVIAKEPVKTMAFPMNIIHEVAEQEDAFAQALYKLGMGRVMSRFLGS